MNVFALRPYPETHESLVGYLIRLTWMNGMIHLEKLLLLLGLPRHMSRSAPHWDTEHAHSVVEALAPWLRRAPDQVFPHLEQQLNLVGRFVQYRLIQDLYLRQLRLCPHCLTERGYFDWRWQLAPLAHCPEHQCLLLDHCPQCQTPFKLHGDLLTQCPHCKLEWSTVTCSVHESTPLETTLWHVITDNSVDIRTLEALLTTISCLARPYDSMWERHPHLPVLRHYAELVAQAYRMLQSSSARAHWRHSCEQERANLMPLGRHWLTRPLDHWENLLHRIPYTLPGQIDEQPGLKTVSATLHEYEGMLSKYRRSCSMSIAPRFQLPDYEVDTVLPECHLSKSTLKDSFAPVNGTWHKTTYINLASIATHLARLTQPAPPDWIEVTESTLALSLHFARFEQLAKAVLQHTVDGRLDDMTCTRIWLAPVTFAHWLDEQLQHACKQDIPVFEFEHRFDCDQSTLLIYLHQVSHLRDEPTRQYQLIQILQQHREARYGNA